jgi:hypothetical protein
MGLVNSLLLHILETGIYLGGVQLSNCTCIKEGLFYVPFLERTIFTCNNKNFRKESTKAAAAVATSSE